MRPYSTVIIWSQKRCFKAERFYTLLTNGTIRELKSHRNVREATYLRHVSKAMVDGHKVTFETCNADFNVVRRADFQRI